MKSLDTYNIPFVGLKLGQHTFHYIIDENFFDLFDNSPISLSNVAVQLELLKKESMMDLGFNFSGWVNVECDRCAENFNLEIEDRFQVFVKFKKERQTDDDENNPDVIFISQNDTHINVANLIYEFIVLSIPIHKTHPEDKNGNSLCNPEVLKRLAYNDNNEEENNNEDNDIDPRWEALSKLKN